MSLQEPASWIVSYDISDARRGARVLKLMKKHGLPLQYSVFVVRATGAAMYKLMRELERLIKSNADDIRAYRVPAATECHRLGATVVPGGVVVGHELLCESSEQVCEQEPAGAATAAWLALCSP